VRALLVAILVIVGIVGLAAGVVYLIEPAHSLLHFMPGYVAGAKGKRTKHGYIALGGGAVLIIIAIVIGMAGQTKRHGSLR
jgi:hypothetical protein